MTVHAIFALNDFCALCLVPGPVLLRNVYLEAPEGGAKRPGDTATLRLRVVNDSARDDRPENVRSAVAGASTSIGTTIATEPFSQAYYVRDGSSPASLTCDETVH
jgi:hypothetical protein